MNRTYLLVTLFVILLFVNDSKFILAENGVDQSFGVNIGDQFNLLVTDTPERPSVSQGGELPAGVNITALLNLNLDNFTLRPIIDPLPAIGTPISYNITKFPISSAPGIIRYNISQNYTNFNSNFILGEPVVSTEWDRWLNLINTMEDQQTVDDKVMTVNHLELNATYFTSILSFKPEIPDSIRLLVPSIEIKQTLRYFVSSGIRDLIKVEIAISVLFFGTFVSTTSLEYISDSYTQLQSLKSSSPDDFPIFLIPVIVFAPIGFILLFRKYYKSISLKK